MVTHFEIKIDVNMEEHMKFLGKTCRLCGLSIKTDKGYLKPKTCVEFKEIILDVYGIQCDKEDFNIYPQNICSNCKRNLSRLGNNPTRKEAAVFYPHNANDCYCHTSSKRKYGKQAPSYHKKLSDLVFSRNGFMQLNSAGDEWCYFKAHKVDKNVVVDMTLSIKEDRSWVLCVFDTVIDTSNCLLLKELPVKISDENVESFASVLSSFQICVGNKDFCDVIGNRIEFKLPFPSRHDSCAAQVETSIGGVAFSKEKFDVIRSAGCQRLFAGLDGQICCSFCNDFKKKLLVYRERVVQDETKREFRVSDSSPVNIRHLSVEELQERLANANKSKREALRKAARLSVIVKELVEKVGVSVDEESHELFQDIMNTNSTPFEEDTPQWLLWQQQLEQSMKKDSRGMRWHPLIIRWCLSIYHTSPAAYKQLSSKRNKFIVLPHINTLKKYTNFTTPAAGFNPDVIDRLVEDSKLTELQDYQKNVSLVFDEMKIKSDLVYSKANGKLIGFTEMGNVNEEFRLFQEHCEGKESSEREFARYVNVYMVRGIFTKLIYPFGYYASAGLTADQLFPCTLEATRVLEAIGFKVRTWVCDGASPNRKFFQICQADGPGETYFYTWNPFDPSRKIYYISDVPHLLKTTRNNIENSHGNRNTRYLHYEKQDISWNHIVNVYEWDLGLHRAAPGLRRLHKLTEEHVKLSPRLRMRVKLAAQVLSNSVASALIIQNEFYTKSTIKFVQAFDRAFDCLNGTSSQNYGKPDRAPYRNQNDPRFDYLQQVLDYLKKWRDEANATLGMTQEEKNKLCLSLQTDHGWHITIKSFIELGKLLLQEQGVRFILSEKFSQDPLEEHFARQRRSGGSNENPSLYEFERQELALNVMHSELISDLRGNTSGRQTDPQPLDIEDMRKLPIKRKH